MGITNFINRVSNATQEIKEAITRKGVVVGECDSLEDMPDRIDEINTQGGSGSAVYTFLAFTSSTSKPSTPTGGSLTEDLTFTYPLGWSDGSSLSSDIWVTYADFTTDGIVKSWHAPVKVSGGSSTGSVDLTDYALKSWVLEQIKESINPGGIIDLSKYATKEYVDQKISELDPSGGTGIYVKSINGSTGEIKFQGDGVSQSGNTFTFAGGSGSGTTTSINGETGALTFTGSALTQSGKTFTFNSAAVDPKTGVTSVNDLKGDVTLAGSSTVSISKSGNTLTFTASGGSGDGVSKDYVDEQDASTLKSAKDYADGLVKASGVTSLNSITGDVTISEGSNITITKSGNDLKISATDSGTSTPGEPGESYITAQLFTAHSSSDDNDPPTVPAASSTYDTNTHTVINPPAGWAASATKTNAKKYIWTIWGTFAESTGEQVGNWTTPACLTGPDGPKGEDGDEIEEVYCLNKEAVVPAVSSSSADQNGKTKSEDGYLPKFVFNGTSQNSVASQPSVSEEYPYCYAAKRRKHNGSWLDFSDAYLVANFVKQGLSQDDKDLIQAEVSSQIGSSLEDANKRITAIQDRVENIDGTDATFLVDNKEGIIQAITQYKDENQESFSDLVLDGSEAKIKAWAGGKFTEDGKTLLKDAGIDLDGMDATVKQWATFYDEATMKTGSVRQILDGEKSAILTEATKATEDQVNIAYTKWDADKATITSDVAKAQQFWGEYDKDKIKIIKQTDYDLSNVGENKTYKNVEAYETAMENAGWTKIIVTEALSRISQEAGKLTLAVNEGSSWASIVAKANESTGSELCLDADRINLTGTTNATTAVIGGATIKDATITNGSITNAQINSCTIASEIRSKNYNNGESGTKSGFLFDAASNEGEFAIYAKSPKWTTGDPDVVISSNEFKIPAGIITGPLTANQIDASQLRVSAANIDGELTATKIKAKSITVDELNTGNILNWLNGAIEVSSLRTISDSGTITIKENTISLTDKNDNQALTVSGDDISGVTSPVSKNLTFTGGLTLDTWDAATELNNSRTATKTFTGYTSSATFSDAANQGLRINALSFNFVSNISATVSSGNDPDNLDGTYDITISLYANNVLVRSETTTYHTWYSSTYGNFILSEMYGGEPVDSTLTFSSSFISARGASVDIKYKIEVVASFQMDSGQKLQDFAVGGNVNVLTTNGKNIIQATTVGTANGASIGANGMIFAQDGEHYIQILNNKVAMIAGNNAIELSDSSFRMRINSTWYNVKAESGFLKLS